ncbi:MAG: hypothetical protein Tsb0014_07800 [Pleurocapsa sp.]
MTNLYQDKYIVCDESAITIYWYYFPLGTSKTIPYNQIKQVTQVKLTWFQGKLRIWGIDTLPYWFHLDLLRPTKNKFIAIDNGKFIQPAITPQDIDTVFTILQDKIKLHTQ